MTWQSAAIQFPPSAQSLSDAVDATLAQGSGEITSALARLGDISPSFAANPTASTATGSAANQNALVDLFGADMRALVVHPYQEGVGQGESYSRHLSAPNAQQALAAKLGDAWDNYKPSGNLEAVCVLFAEQTLAAFATRLKAVCGLFPISELCEAEHRAEQLLRLESEKSVLPGAPLGGYWRPRKLTQLQTARWASEAIGAEIASAYGYEVENTDPLQELQTLAAKKQQYLDQVRADTASLAAQFVGTGNTYCLFATGTTREIANQVLASKPFDHDHVFSAAMLFAAAPGELTILRELFGL
ncbi:hypothetical protein [Microbulbifer sp. VAAF005]|uniref:hypothetical protein n=1 Tax=Microbulbifer sp. VAAF005 TaxID=3034230 RepID=UPI0024ADC2C8|nr:hypothetical protein [Microbulbifer sp. VAAF005]WHI46816.1 hypothetical protein P0078_00120 [Microbulbifer sp. VAAF005]